MTTNTWIWVAVATAIIYVIVLFIRWRIRRGVLEKQQKQLQEINDFAVAMSRGSVDIFILDAEKKTSTTIKTSGVIKDMDERTSRSYDQTWSSYIEKYVHPDDRERVLAFIKIRNVMTLLENDTECSCAYRILFEGKVRNYQVTFTYLGDHRDSKIVFDFQNVDDIVQQEQERNAILEESMAHTAAANKAKNDFLLNLSRDLRIPMNTVIGFTNLIEKNLDDKEKCTDYISKVRKATDFLLSIIDNVQEMASLESGKLLLDERAYSMALVAMEISSAYEDLMKQRDIDFSTSIDIKTKYVYCDLLKLKEIYLNLITNAFKYTPEGGKVSVSLHELPCETPGYTVIQAVVSDTGIGMSKEYLPHVFDLFFREHEEDSQIEGAGLGMPIVKKLVDMMGGRIEVESEVGKGTTFTLTFTHKIAEESAIMMSVEQVVADFSGKRILLAEDNDLNAEIAEAVLTEVGFDVERVADGEQCVIRVSSASSGTYDLILMDIQMPNMNGYDATRKIRALSDGLKAKIPIVAMTASAFAEDKLKALEVGMNDHISKPIEVPLLMEMLTRYIK